MRWRTDEDTQEAAECMDISRLGAERHRGSLPVRSRGVLFNESLRIGDRSCRDSIARIQRERRPDSTHPTDAHAKSILYAFCI